MIFLSLYTILADLAAVAASDCRHLLSSVDFKHDGLGEPKPKMSLGFYSIGVVTCGLSQHLRFDC
jgi:hypothetical protein